MHRFTKLLSISRWIAIAVSLVVIATWVFSYRWFAFYQAPHFTMSINGFSHNAIYGPGLYVEHRTHHAPGSAYLDRELQFITRHRWINVSLDTTAITVIATTIVLCIADFVLKRRSRVRLGYCRTCGYDLTNNLSGRCPECGTPIASAPAHRPPHRSPDQPE